MSDRERLFFGISLDAEAAAIVGARQAQLGSHSLPVRLVPEENLHLTLRFIGSVEPLDRERILAGIAETGLPGSFSIRLKGWGAFPRATAAKVIWIGVEDSSGRLQALHELTDRAAVLAGFPSEERPYRPHLTVARLRFPADVRPALGGLEGIDLSVVVSRCTLFRSIPGSGHPRYDPICSFILSGHESLRGSD